MQTSKITIFPEDYYVFEFAYLGNILTYGGNGSWLIENVFKGTDKIPQIDFQTQQGPQQDHLEDLKHDLKQVYIALSRAVEEGDQLKIGIVLGQTISKLETLINQ